LELQSRTSSAQALGLPCPTFVSTNANGVVVHEMSQFVKSVSSNALVFEQMQLALH